MRYAKSGSSVSLSVELQVKQLTFSVHMLGERIQLTRNHSSYEQSVANHPENAHGISEQDGLTLQEGTSGRSEGDSTDLNAAFAEYRSIRPSRPVDSAMDDSGLSPASTRDLSRQSTLVESNDTGMPRLMNKVRSMPESSSQSTCSLECNCACHRRNRLKSPDILRTVIGSLYVGYKASPSPSQSCDKGYCRSQATKITYAFPQWLVRRAISVSMAYSYPQGPDLCLRMMRVRPGDANIFTAVYRGTCYHIQRLLNDNEASVWDVDPMHNTALLVRINQAALLFLTEICVLVGCSEDGPPSNWVVNKRRI